MRLIYPSFLVATFLLLAMVAKAEASGCKAAHPWPYTRNTLRVGETLTTGESLESKTAKLILQSDGNLVLYRKKDNAAVWQTGTGLGQCNGTAAKLTMTATGFNLVDNTHTCWTTAFASPSQIAVVRDHCTFDVFTEAPYTNQTWNTGPARCIEAHIVPHSHDDVGWLLTPERYYDGCQTQGGGVRFIISTIVEALQQNPNRTFNQVESYFFNRWWKEQNETTKAVVKDLVASGQLVFLNGGWSMHDEACVHQESAISNMEVGARFLKEELGVELNIGWHIDPFGHASSTPRYMAEMGFDAFFFWRTDYEQRQHNLQTKQFEVVWHNSPSLGNKTKMFTSIMYNNYCMGCADKTCPSEYFSYWCEYSPHDLDRTAQLSSHHQNPVMTLFERQAQQQQKKTTAETLKRAFGASEVYSDIKALADMYVESVAAYEDAFRTGHVLMPWGCDFGHQAALEDYTLMDQLIDYVNDHYADYGVHMFYSTAQRYVKDVQAMNYQWPLNEFDYFLDSDGGHSYWSGYLSSRAEYKGFERELMNERTAVELVLSAVPTTDLLHPNTQLARTQVMREALGVAQHHDSITGTERTWVRNQYQNILTLARNNITQVFDDVYNQSFGVETTTCRLANLSYCEATNGLATGASVSVYAFNPIAQQRTEIITVPVPVEGVSAYLMPGSTLLVSQVVTTWELTTTVDNTSPPVPSHHPYQLYVQVPLSAQSLVEIMLVANASVKAVAEVPLSADGARIENEHYALKFNGTTGMLSSVLNKDTNVASPLTQSISRYCPYPSQPHEQASGAYIMRTCDPHSPLIPYATNFSASVVSGPLCREVRQLISGENNMQQSVRVCNGQSWVEITSGIGEVKTYDTGVEVIMHLGTDVDSAGVWYTDSQALEMQQRVRDSRPNYPYTLTEPIASNFFPCNAFSYINSSSRASKNMAVMADRSRATASIVDGELQFLVQRRLIYDDNRGVGEPLDEHTRVLTTSRVVFNTNDLFRDMRIGSLQQTHKPVLRYGAPSHSSTPFQWLSRGSDAVLPPNVHLHTRTLLTPGVVLVRLQHLFAVGEGDLAVPVQVSLAAALPSGAFITNVTDMDMNGVMEASRLSRIDFPTCDNNGVVQHIPPRPIGGSSPVTGEVIHEVTLNPMEIRVLKIEYTVFPL